MVSRSSKGRNLTGGGNRDPTAFVLVRALFCSVPFLHSHSFQLAMVTRCYLISIVHDASSKSHASHIKFFKTSGQNYRNRESLHLDLCLTLLPETSQKCPKAKQQSVGVLRMTLNFFSPSWPYRPSKSTTPLWRRPLVSFASPHRSLDELDCNCFMHSPHCPGPSAEYNCRSERARFLYSITYESLAEKSK